MPRAKVPFAQRRRVVQACDTCKRRKEKCNGSHPCSHCITRRKEYECRYTGRNRNGSRRNNGNSSAMAAPPPPTEPFLRETSHDGMETLERIDSLLDRSIEDYAPSRKGRRESSTTSDPTVLPKLSRMLRDDNGRFMFLGDSASSSFLQNVRRTVLEVNGPGCEFVVDRQRHQMFENTHPVHSGLRVEPIVEFEHAQTLARNYNLAVSGVLDLFDYKWLANQLEEWTADENRSSRHNSPVVYLALAVGAQGMAQTDADEKLAEDLFSFGRQCAVTLLMDDPSLVTVQTFALITYYMIASCRRNSAFVNLGVAIRAAYALGIHRHEANRAFVKEEGISRERTWKTIRVCDLFLSASMGRPLATSETDCNIPYLDLASLSSDRASATVEAQATSAIFRICHIFERVLDEIYAKRAVSLDLAGSISQQHKEWTLNRSAMLKVDGLIGDEEADMSVLCRKLGSNHVTVAYYWSIILLTRPFLSFVICSRSDGNQSRSNAPPVAACRAYAAACIDSAIKSIQLCSDMTSDDKMPTKQPLVINSAFYSALVLGFAYFGDYDRQGWDLGRWLGSAIEVLQNLSARNQHAGICENICRLLKDAVAQYIRKRDDDMVLSSSQVVQSLFGDIHGGETLSTGLLQPSPLTMSTESLDTPRTYSPSLSESANRNAIFQDSIITTSGILAEGYDDSTMNQHCNQFDLGTNMDSFLTAIEGGDLNNFPLDEEVPLFFLTDIGPDDNQNHMMTEFT